jgi:ABC-2 type transport system ATP-binding protein
MKTLSFRELKVGRKASRILLELDTASDGFTLRSGLNVIVAPNGYGKTTFLQTLAGVLPALSGQARLDDRAVDPDRDVLYVSEYLNFPKFIYPSEYAEFLAGGAELRNAGPWIQGFRLEGLMKTYLGRMSQGERRKVTWLGAHCSPAPLLLLDEPLDGLDLLAIHTAREMLASWKSQGRIVCIVAHQVGEVLDLADRVLLIRDSKFADWTALAPRPPRELAPEEFRAKVLAYYASSPATQPSV